MYRLRNKECQPRKKQNSKYADHTIKQMLDHICPRIGSFYWQDISNWKDSHTYRRQQHDVLPTRRRVEFHSWNLTRKDKADPQNHDR